jgi:hypothetical protein
MDLDIQDGEDIKAQFSKSCGTQINTTAACK